jgi:hypothetical protein
LGSLQGFAAAVSPPLFTSDKREVSLAGGNRGIQKCDSIDPLSLVIKCLGRGGVQVGGLGSPDYIQTTLSLWRPSQHIHHTGWPPLMPDAVPVGVGDWFCWQGWRFWRRVRGRNAGEFIIGREEGVRIADVVGINDGKMTVVGSTGVTPTFTDGGPGLVNCLDNILGEDIRSAKQDDIYGASNIILPCPDS